MMYALNMEVFTKCSPSGASSVNQTKLILDKA